MRPVPFTLWGDLLGSPFVEGGRGPSGYDCVGLAMEFQRRRGARLPAYLSHPEELHRQMAAGGVLDAGHRLEEPEPGCVILLRTGIHERHLGSMVDAYRMLHTMQGIGCAVTERILDPQWVRRILGFYRVEIVH